MATKLFNIRIDVGLHKRFKDYCEKNDVNMTNLMVGYIESIVDKNEVPKKMQGKRHVDYDPLEAVRSQYNDEI